jgi:hypothetical protein
MLASLSVLRRRLRRGALCGACLLSGMLAACGGGGDSAAPTTAQSIANGSSDGTAGVAVSSFSPASGARGSTIAVSGSGLSSVTSARLGGVDAPFRATSDTTLEITVPVGASTVVSN